jgi:hypothetical protein
VPAAESLGSLSLSLRLLLLSGKHGKKRGGSGGGFSAAITAAVILLFIGWAIANDGRSFDM